MDHQDVPAGGSGLSQWFFGPAAIVAAFVGLAAVVVGLVYVVYFAGLLFFAFGDNAREVPEDVLLPLPSGLVVVSGPERSCPQGARPAGDCSLKVVIGPKSATGDMMGTLRGHLRDRGWQVAPRPEIVLFATLDELCLGARTPAQLGQYLRRYDHRPVSYAEYAYGLNGGLPTVDDRHVLFLRVGYQGCTR